MLWTHYLGFETIGSQKAAFPDTAIHSATHLMWIKLDMNLFNANASIQEGEKKVNLAKEPLKWEG